LAAELRWILLGLGLLLLAGVWWWTARRAGQTPGNAELRESTAGKVAEPMPALDPRYADADEEDMRTEPESRHWGVPPFEPLHIRTAEFDRVPVLDAPMMVNVEAEPSLGGSAMAAPSPTPAPAPLGVSRPVPTVMPATPAPTVRPMAAGAVTENSDRFAAVTQPAAAAAELQRIVTIRVCAVGEARWSGTQLMAALEQHGLAFGRYQVFHRKHVDGRSLFCVASLVEPGTFELATMPNQEFRGVTLFAVLPGPMQPLETIDELFETARDLAGELAGMVQDAKGLPLSPQRASALREDVARFQALLPRN
jgi:cell division protein ZipA